MFAAGRGAHLAEVNVYAHASRDVADLLLGNGSADLARLAARISGQWAKTDASGAYRIAALPIHEGPFIVVAVNARSQDFRGLDRQTRKPFSFRLGPGEEVPTFSDPGIGDMVFPTSGETTVNFELPAEEPGAPAAEELAASPGPLPTPSAGPTIAPSPERPFVAVVTWDRGGGHDLDLHVYDTTRRQESWVGKLQIESGSLDLDNSEGFGPEVFTGKAGRYGVSVNYWHAVGTPGTTVWVRVIVRAQSGSLVDRTYQKTLTHAGEWWDVGLFDTPS